MPERPVLRACAPTCHPSAGRSDPTGCPGTSAGYTLTEEVGVDWGWFQRLTRAGAELHQLYAGLRLIRGRPFADVPTNRFSWIYSELLVSEMEVAMVSAAKRAATVALGGDGNLRLAAWSGRGVGGGVVGRRSADAHQRQEGDFRDQPAPAEPDHRKLATGNELVGEGPGDAEQLTRLGDREDQAVIGGQGDGCGNGYGVCGGGHGPDDALWTSTPKSTERSTPWSS